MKEAPMKDWLVMLYLGGENDLFRFGEKLIDEAARAGSSERVAIVAEVEPERQGQQIVRGPIVRGRHRASGINLKLGRQARTKTIIEFADDSQARYPARHRALVLWDHGNGWQTGHVFENVVSENVEAFPDSERLFVNELREVLDEKRRIAIVGFDACLMSMIEIAFQLRDTAQFMVGSQHLVPAAHGWPYEALLRTLTSHSRMEPEELVRTMVDTFAGSYNGASEAVTLTALRLSTEVDRAVSAIDAFSQELLRVIHESDHIDGDARGEIVFARQHAQSFGNPDYIDLVSFCSQIEKRLPDEKLRQKAALVRDAIGRMVVRHTRSGANSIREANGVSIYFPTLHREAHVAQSYAKLDFAKPEHCRWSTFLTTIVEGVEADCHCTTMAM
jgi:hypothetical protein